MGYYRTDSKGRTVEAMLDNAHTEYTAERHPVQTRVGHQGDRIVQGVDGTETVVREFEGGHILGAQFGGIYEALNYWPMRTEVNRGPHSSPNSFAAVESEVARLVNDPANHGKRISLRVTADFDPDVQAAAGLHHTSLGKGGASLGANVPTRFVAEIMLGEVPYLARELENVKYTANGIS